MAARRHAAASSSPSAKIIIIGKIKGGLRAAFFLGSTAHHDPALAVHAFTRPRATRTGGALIASLPLISVLGMIWLWREKPDAANMAVHAEATFWYVLPSLPMFLPIPAMLWHGISFWASLIVGCLVTIGCYLVMIWLGPRFGLRL